MSDHPDLPGDDAVELASRYLDGDLGLDERAAAEADPEVMTWVDRFRGIQRALREPIGVDAGARDAAITAALAALDAEPADDLAPPPGIGDLAAARARRTQRLGRWLGAAAAVAALAVGGAALVANSGGSDDDSADDAAVLSFESRIEGATTASPSDNDAAADSATAPIIAAAPGSPESTTAAEATRQGETATTEAGGDTDAADDEASGGAPATTEASTDTTAAATAPATTAVQSYSSATDLAPLADSQPVTLGDGREAPCPDVATGELVAVDVTYAGVPAVVYRDAAIHTLTAWAVGSCERLADYVYPAD